MLQLISQPWHSPSHSSQMIKRSDQVSWMETLSPSSSSTTPVKDAQVSHHFLTLQACGQSFVTDTGEWTFPHKPTFLFKEKKKKEIKKTIEQKRGKCCQNKQNTQKQWIVLISMCMWVSGCKRRGIQWIGCSLVTLILYNVTVCHCPSKQNKKWREKNTPHLFS